MIGPWGELAHGLIHDGARMVSRAHLCHSVGSFVRDVEYIVVVAELLVRLLLHRIAAEHRVLRCSHVETTDRRWLVRLHEVDILLPPASVDHLGIEGIKLFLGHEHVE